MADSKRKLSPAEPAPTAPAKGKHRFLIVDDSAVARRLLANLLGDVADFEVVGSASNGITALRRIEQLQPHLILLDLEMPDMDGLELLAKLQALKSEIPVLVVSSISRRGALSTIEALSLGARDYVTKPSSMQGTGLEEFRQTLIAKVRALLERTRPAPKPRPVVSAETPQVAVAQPARVPTPERVPELLLIGTSTGGPEALTLLLRALPATFPLPIAIVQHMPPLFTRYLARSLNDACRLRVDEACTGDGLEPGRVLLAPGGHHMRVLRRQGRLQVFTSEDEPVNSCRPSVDVLFESAAEVCGGDVLAVVLTGMGNDGTQGARRLHARGATVFAQDEASSVVWGMPAQVVRAGVAARVLPLDAMAEAIEAHLAPWGGGASRTPGKLP